MITHVGKLAIYMRAFLCVFSSGSGVIPSSEKTSGDPSAEVLPETIETWMDLSLLQFFDIKCVKWRIGRHDVMEEIMLDSSVTKQNKHNL